MSEEKQFVNFESIIAGLAESKFLGLEGSFAKAVGIDYRSEPGIIKAQQALKKDSGSTVVDLIMVSVHTSAGHSYHFGDAGKIYKRTSAGSWSVLQTVTATPKILGAAEHSDGYVYFTYANKVGRIQVSDDAYTEAWSTLTNTNTNYGPVIYHEKRDAIFIGNQELVARVSAASAFTTAALDLKLTKWEIRGLAPYDIDVLVGATLLGASNFSRFFQWDGTSVSWQFSKLFGEEIKWMENKQETVLILGGNRGKLYDYEDLVDPWKQIPGEYSSTAIFESNPNAKCIHDGMLHFGVHDGSSGIPFSNGVYTFGSKDKEKFPISLNCEYAISTNELDGIEIGCVSTNGGNLFVSWKNKAGNAWGMDVIDVSNKYGSAFIEFLVIRLDRNIEKTFDRFPCNFKPLASGCRITLKQKVDHATAFSTVATVGGQPTELDTIVQPGGGTPLVNGTYKGVATTKTEGSGDNKLTVDVVVSGGNVTAVTVNVGGVGYEVNDTITITGLAATGGGGDDDGTVDIKTLKTDETDDRGIFDGDNVEDGNIIQPRLEFVTNSNDTPEVEELGCVWSPSQFE